MSATRHAAESPSLPFFEIQEIVEQTHLKIISCGPSSSTGDCLYTCCTGYFVQVGDDDPISPIGASQAPDYRLPLMVFSHPAGWLGFVDIGEVIDNDMNDLRQEFSKPILAILKVERLRNTSMSFCRLHQNKKINNVRQSVEANFQQIQFIEKRKAVENPWHRTFCSSYAGGECRSSRGFLLLPSLPSSIGPSQCPEAPMASGDLRT